MQLLSQPKSTVSANLSSTESEQLPILYRGWVISTEVIKKQLWVRWQHPLEDFPRYGCPVTDDDVDSAINNVKSTIDITIDLEQSSSGTVNHFNR